MTDPYTKLARIAQIGITGGYMQRSTFDHLVIEIGFRAHEKAVIETLRLMYVDGLDRPDAIAETGVSKSTLAKAKDRFDAALEQYREKLGLVREDFILSKPNATLVKWIEQRDLNAGNAIDPNRKKEIDEAADRLLKLLLSPSD